MRILLVEDDTAITLGLVFSLEQEQFEVKSCATVCEALALLKTMTFDLVLLDINLPDGLGFEVCQSINGRIPVIFLTASDEEVSVVMGLEMGADDYITKPFRVRELIARIKSVLRRSQSEVNSSVMALGHVMIYPTQGKVLKDSSEVPLTALEYRLLMTLVNHQNQVLSRVQLLDGIWDIAGDFVNDNTLTVYIKRLREKLELDPSNPTLIHTVRGLGYKLEVTDAKK